MSTKMQLGDKMQDRVTGFTGIAVSFVVYFNGCQRFLLQPPVDKDGKDQDACWVDIQQLRVLEKQAVPRMMDQPTAQQSLPQTEPAQRPGLLQRLFGWGGGQVPGVVMPAGGGPNPDDRKHL